MDLSEKVEWEDRCREGLDYGIAQLEQHAKNIPPGWQKLYAHCIASLRAVNCPKRSRVNIFAPDTSLGMLSIGSAQGCGSDDADRVIHGILHKAHTRSCCTCEICGRRAAGTSARIWRTLCPRCRLHLEMHSDIKRLLKTLGPNYNTRRFGPVVPIAQLSLGVRELIPQDIVRSLETQEKSHEAPYVLLQDMKKLQPTLERAGTVLKRLIGSQE